MTDERFAAVLEEIEEAKTLDELEELVMIRLRDGDAGRDRGGERVAPRIDRDAPLGGRQAREPRVSCLVGESLWRNRWGN